MKIWKGFVLVFLSGLLLAFLFQTDYVGDLFLPNMPNVTFKPIWGKRDINASSIIEIVIKVPETTLENLKIRLENRIVSTSLLDSNFLYGFNVDYLNNLINYWLNEYQWRLWEAKLNKFQHYFTTIKGLQMHFVHVKPILKPNQKLIPILLLHGWPGSFFEFYKLIPFLSKSTEKENYAFEIICPSLVGYGWSDAVETPGFDIFAMSDIMFLLMERLNITNKFYIQGGDFGSFIASAMSKINPDKVAGIHVNMAEIPFHDLRFLTKVFIGSMLPSSIHFLSPEELNMLYPFTENLLININRMGYFFLQATRPSTIGIILSDTPTGLAAYILEKFGAWTHNHSYHLNRFDGGLETMKITKDEMLTNIMIYYITNSISSSVRLYKEFLSESCHKLIKIPVKVPAGIAVFPHELFRVPRTLAAIKYRDIRQFTHMPRGGHFAAFEEPELLSKDIISFVKLVENL